MEDWIIVRRGLSVGLIILVLVMLVGAQRLSEPDTWALAQAMRELGPVGGWRCAQSGAGAYVYDPRRERPDSGLLADAPEATLRVAVPEVTVERVEADLRGGDTVVWSRIGGDADTGTRRVYVLSPGRMQAVTLNSAGQSAIICQSHMGDWRIVAEHALG